MARINFDLQQLEAFVAVAERGSFRAAADHIHLSPPALSRRIDKLETILGARLFNRTTRDVELTALGQVFLDRARAALDDLESAMLGITDIAGSRTGRVTVACVPSAAIHFLPSVVSSFAERYPLIRVRVIDEAAGTVMATVVSGESDFGITFMGNQVPGVDFEPIHSDPFVVAMPRRHALAGRKTLSWKNLEAERLIAVARTSGNRQLLDDALAKAGVNPSYRLEVSHIATLLGMVDAGLGLAAVPRLALPKQHPSIVGVALTAPAVSRVLGLATLRGTTLRAPAKMFHDYLHTALKDRR
ncbi:LysR family transcriptional regulator [Polaromonas sp. A23]|uniref:LysR family transcriptional regulator n=1 Tax=Polaromonas sp. A23 TaxID=1944133 RepID=UPI0009871634|nr:LysR family transcriptional regulator [Polaromonas sp. A23]OOG45377.1 LysR family transcriptional regulator [Polaromonas sp. A23]